MTKGVIKVSGMSSEEDVAKVSHALKEVWGVRDINVSLGRQEAVFTYNDQSASTHDFIQALKDQGYEAEFTE
ncbi:MAG: heavy-metal-associated domain-containing protein [Tuberibacillus sp.]